MNVAIIGATDDPLKYAYQALKMLEQNGHNPIPINPNKESIEGHKCYAAIGEVPEPIDTVTLYVRPDVSTLIIDDIITVKPRRVIMNPGTENDELERRCENSGINVIRGCTLVMLGSGQF